MAHNRTVKHIFIRFIRALDTSVAIIREVINKAFWGKKKKVRNADRYIFNFKT